MAKSEKKVPRPPRARKPKAVAGEVVADPAAEAQPETVLPAPVEKSEPSLLDEILQAGEDFAGSKVAEAISMANTILHNAQAVAALMEAMAEADKLALQKLSFNRLESEVKEEWYALPLTKVEARLQTWLKEGDAAAKHVLTLLEKFKKSQVDVLGPLWQLLTEVVRPAWNVRSYHDLSQLMRGLYQKGLVETLHDRRNPPDKAVVLRSGEYHTVAYLPAMERGRLVPMAEAGWPFVKEAETRAKEWADVRRSKMAELEKSASGLTASQAEAGQEGTFFLKVGENRGALVQACKGDRGPRIRVAQAIGFMFRGTNWFSWNAGEDAWPDGDLFRAFTAWKNPKA